MSYRQEDKQPTMEEAVEFWTPLVCNEDGSLNEEAVFNELHDFYFMIKQVPQVYSVITGGMLSKPNYYASGVIQAHEEYLEILLQEAQHEAVKDALDDIKHGESPEDILSRYPGPEYG